ncbi:hypothetical protein ACA910_017190 [Epithemia clementina (nom. ined.)]
MMGDLQYQNSFDMDMHTHAQQVHTPSPRVVSSPSSRNGTSCNEEGWSCPTCTFYNKVSGYLACEICGETRPPTEGDAVVVDDYADSGGDIHVVEDNIVSVEDDDHERRLQEREAQVEREHQALVNARLEEIIDMQHRLFANIDNPSSNRSNSDPRVVERGREQSRLVEREREISLLDSDREHARLERERDQERLEREMELLRVEEDLRLREESLERQRQELEELKQSVTKSQLLSSSTSDAFGGEKQFEREQRRISIPKSRPGATAVPGPGASPSGSASPSLLDRKYEKLEQERLQLEQQQRELMQRAWINGTPPSVPRSSDTPEMKFGRLEQERLQMLRQQQEMSSVRSTGSSSNQSDQSSSGVFSALQPNKQLSGLTLEQQQNQVKLLLQAQRNATAMQQQYAIQEPSRTSSTRLPPPTPVRCISRSYEAQRSLQVTPVVSGSVPSEPRPMEPGYTVSTPNARFQQRQPQPIPHGRVVPPQVPSSPRRSSFQQQNTSAATGSAVNPVPPPPAAPQQEVRTPPASQQRKGRMGGLGGLILKRPSILSRGTSAPVPTTTSTEDLHRTPRSAEYHGIPQPPQLQAAVSGGRLPRHVRGPVRDSVAERAIAGLDQLIDDPSPVWDHRTKKR